MKRGGAQLGLKSEHLPKLDNESYLVAERSRERLGTESDAREKAARRSVDAGESCAPKLVTPVWALGTTRDSNRVPPCTGADCL